MGSITILLIICCTTVVIGCVAVFFLNCSLKKSKQELSAVKRELREKGFHNSYIYDAPDYCVGFNEPIEKVACIDKAKPRDYKILDFSKIVSAEIIQNDESVIKTNMGSALVWGNYASKRVEQHITKLGVRLVINDLSDPMVYVNCINSRKEIDKLYAAFVTVGERNKTAFTSN